MINQKIEERLFESEIMSFSIPAEDPKAQDLIEDAALEFEGKRYFISSIEDTLDDQGMALKTVEAEVSWMRLADIKKVGSFVISECNAGEGLSQILVGTPWTMAYCFDTPDFNYEGQDLTVLALVWAWARVVGGEPTFDTMNQTISLDVTSGATRGIAFRYGRNIKEIKRTSQPPAFTRCYPFGRDDLDIKSATGGVPYIEDYSWYTAQGVTLPQAQAMYQKDDLFSDDSVVDVAVLFAMAEARLAVGSRPTIKYEAKVVDLQSPSWHGESIIHTGDYAQVYDEIEGGLLPARVSRRVWWPLAPENDEIELAFNTILLPNPSSTSSRSSQSKTWELFTNTNPGIVHVRAHHTILGRIKVDHIESAEWVVGYSIEGVGVAGSTLTLEFSDDTADEPFWTTQITDLVDGQVYNHSFSFGQEDLPAGTTTFVVRGYTDSSANGLNIEPGRTNLWVLARGSTKQSVTLENSIRYEHVATIQKFQVPDDVTELLLEVAAGCGGGQTFNSVAGGGIVRGRLPVIAGSILDIYVGGCPAPIDSRIPGWPNGGGGGAVSGSNGNGGGGSSDVRPEGGDPSTTYLMAGAGGGAGQQFHSNPQTGGHGGFYQGQPTEDIDSPGTYPGGPATQLAGGLGGVGSYSSGGNGSFFQAGSAGGATNAFTFPPGGGGGGWYGGGGGGSNNASGSGMGGGGGGGSGWAHESIFDLEAVDGANAGMGYIVISWENPE